jgi:hypothetical protein
MNQKNKNEEEVYLKNRKNGGKLERAGNEISSDDKSISSATTAITMANF